MIDSRAESAARYLMGTPQWEEAEVEWSKVMGHPVGQEDHSLMGTQYHFPEKEGYLVDQTNHLAAAEVAPEKVEWDEADPEQAKVAFEPECPFEYGF